MNQLIINHDQDSKIVFLIYSYIQCLSGSNKITLIQSKDKSLQLTISTTEKLTLNQPMSIILYLSTEIDKSISNWLFPDNDTIKTSVNEFIEFVIRNKYLIQTDNSLMFLNDHLQLRTFCSSNHLTLSDLIVFGAIHPYMVKNSYTTEFTNILRWYNHIQHIPGTNTTKCIKDEFFVPIQMSKVQECNLMTKSEDNLIKLQVASHCVKDVMNNLSSKKNDDRPIDDPTRISIRVGRILKIWDHPNAEKLYCEQVDLGESQPRDIVSGLRDYIPKEKLLDSKVLVVENMKPRKLRGFVSHGMILCGKKTNNDSSSDTIEIVNPPEIAKVGDQIVIEGLMGDPDKIISQSKDKDTLQTVSQHWNINFNGDACYKNLKFLVKNEPCQCATVRNGTLS